MFYSVTMDNKSKEKLYEELFFDKIIDIFIKFGDDKLQVEVDDMDSDYLQSQFNKRIKARNLVKEISVVMYNDLIYLTNPQVLFQIPSYVDYPSL